MVSSKMSKFSTSLSFFLLIITILSFSTLKSNATFSGDLLQGEYFTVPASQFVSSLVTTIATVQKVTSVVSNVGNFVGDFRLTNAINDCLDLLDFSSDALDWSVSASQTKTNGKDNSTGDLGSDLKTWISAVLANQDTCIDGFEGTNSFVKGVVAGSLGQITSLVQDLLTMIHTPSKSKSSGRAKTEQNLPSWFKYEDQKLMDVKGTTTADAIVAQDGTGQYTKIMDAIAAAPDNSLNRFVIYVKKGVYNEYVEIKKKKWNLVMIGDGMDVTVITGNRSVPEGYTTFRSATFAVSGRGFIARDITFENTAGPQKHQAVALRSDSDLSVFYRCAIKGYQDTLYTHTMRQFYRECRISGTIDFIFGDATVVFQNCQILAKRGLPNQKNTITAHGRKDPNEPTGFSFQFCNFTADADLLPFANSIETYLGRPWKLYSRTVILQSYMSDVIRPKGWLEWNADFALDTLYYGEFKNYGVGAGLGSRVNWRGYHAFNDSAQASNYTVALFIEGNSWLPPTGVTYIAGLTV
ncbi:Pectinesterase/pectinesterase inhibitor PPE8B [Tripterygium wilfordii]|uniref:Pectinesterase n=1 Tax=Tripterygium wilfordii TaxID=458696 RepID=A0A7J7DA24_TRIWF|nr:pectinesterase/pectinesterase inhibitor PPE8B-like [Tripterygium wilfordii]KAF5743134.1 Pectinesterase/pectinesterase inhibitor PPE8B [Tripterygium wilfordii]